MAVLRQIPLGTITLHVCSAAPSHSATNGDIATYNGAFYGRVAGSWAAIGGGAGGAVDSVFGRTGAVVAAANDYSFSQLSGSAAIGQLPTGTTSTTVCIGNDSRLSDSRTPTSHVLATNVALGGQHTISGATAGQVLRASSATAANFQALAVGDLPTGTTSSTVALGDAPAAAITTHVALPDPHTQYALDTDKGAASGIATLTASSQLTASQFPALTGDVTTAGGALATTLKNTGSAGTYRSVTTDAQGRVTAGTNPTTISGYGLTDAEPKRLQARMAANQATAIGTSATALTGLTLALSASTHYRFHAVVFYVCTVTTATLAARAAYSGTLGTTASGQSMFKVYGSNGVPTVWAAAAKETTQAVNAAIITATGGPGNVGSASVAMIEIEGDIFTNAAGNLTIEIVSSAALGITPQADSHLEAWVMT